MVVLAFILTTRTAPAEATEKHPLFVVTGRTIVAFFSPVTDAQLQKDPDANEALADFQLYASRVREPLKKAGIDFHVVYAHSFQVRVGEAVTAFRSAKTDVGYYLVVPGKKPHVEYGVMTDTDLLHVADEYFGQGVQINEQNRPQPLSAEREHILDGQFKVVSQTEGIPANIKRAFSEIVREPSFALANPGEKFQVTDVVVDRKLPFRRLLFAGVRDDNWFIHYERGGRAHGYYVVVFKVDPHGDARFVWGGSGANGAKDLEQLRRMVVAGQFSDAESYW